jgi:hypothetical protein
LPRGEPFEHEADGRQVDEGFRSLDLQLVVFAQATISGQPRKRALHDPSQAHHLEGALPAFGDVQSPPVTALLARAPGLDRVTVQDDHRRAG